MAQTATKTNSLKIRGRIKRLATEHPIVVVPVVVEPVPVLNPAVAVPIDVSNVLGIVGMTLKIVQQPSVSLPLESRLSREAG